MQGFRSRIAIVAIAAACAIATAIVDRVSWCVRTARARVFGFGLWLIEVMPKPARWLRPDIAVHVQKDGGIRMRQVQRRRPLCMPRFRMCPST